MSLSNKNGIKAPSSRGKKDLKDLSRRKKITGRNHHHRTVCVRANLTRVIKRHHRTNRTRLRPFFFFRAQFFRGPDGAREKAKRKCAQNLPLFCKIFAVKRGRKPPQRKRKTRAFILEKTKRSTIIYANDTRTRARSISATSMRIHAKNRTRIAFLHICLPS